MHNFGSIKENPWPPTSFKYLIAHKAIKYVGILITILVSSIIMHYREITVNLEPKSNGQYYLSSSARE